MRLLRPTSFPFGLLDRSLCFFHTPDDGGGDPAPSDPGQSGGGSQALDWQAFDDYMNGGPNSTARNTQEGAVQPPSRAPGAAQATPNQGAMPPQGAQQTGATGQQPGTAPPSPATPSAPDRLPPPPADLFAVPPGPAPATDPNSRVAQLEGYVSALTQHIQSLGSQAPAQQQPQDPNRLLYNFPVHPDVITALNNAENPTEQANALGYALNVTATNVHRNLAREVGTYLRDTLVPNLVAHVEGRAQARDYERTVQSEFYGRHNDLNHPPYRAMVVQVAQGMIQQAQANGAWRGWTPEFADAVANNSRRLLSQRPPGTSAPGFTPTGSRPGNVGNAGRTLDENSPEAIADLIGDFTF